MITPDMRQIIEENTIGLVATVTAEGFPRVSPKGTMRVLDDGRLGFAEIRSPGTLRNLRSNPAVEVTFIDVFRRRACRLQGAATYHPRGTAEFTELAPRFQAWDTLADRMRGFVVVAVTRAEMVRSPIYDLGAKEEQLRRQWLEHYTRLHGA